jgi:hypothetical protein
MSVKGRLLKISLESKTKNIIGARVRAARLAMEPKVSQDDLAGKWLKIAPARKIGRLVFLVRFRASRCIGSSINK